MHGLCVLFKVRAQLLSPKRLDWNNPPVVKTQWDRERVREGLRGYSQHFEVVETLESMARDIPQLIPWDTPRRETQIKKERTKCKSEIWNISTYTKKITNLVRFCLLLYSMFLDWALIWLHPWVLASGLLLGQYANNNILFPSVWLLLAISTPWNLNQSWELWWVSKDWIEWDWDWVNKCSVKVYLLVCMWMCLCSKVYTACICTCVNVCTIFHVLGVN